MGEQKEHVFGFEKLDVYQRSVEFVVAAAGIISELPSGYASLSDQLKRAALSVPVNVAEGVGRTSLADLSSSLRDCPAFSDGMCGNYRCVPSVERRDPGSLADGRSLLLSVVRMLSKMCR